MNPLHQPKLLSLILAVTIHGLPLARTVVSTASQFRPSYAVVFQWLGISAALLGSYDAVSGASTVITSPNNAQGKVGESFSYRVTTAPDQANVFRADSLPPGLEFGSNRRRSFIEGVPTEAGRYAIVITASDDNRPSRTVTKRLTIDIEGLPIPLRIVDAPTDQSIETGSNLFLSVLATGDPPLQFQWYHEGVAIEGATDAVLKIAGTRPEHAGAYHVDITSGSESLTTVPASVSVTTPAPAEPATIESIHLTEAGVALTFRGSAGRDYTVEYRDNITDGSWVPLEQITVVAGDGTQVIDPTRSTTQRFYRVTAN